MPAIEHAQQRLFDVRFQVQRVTGGMRDQVDARQGTVGHQGLRAHMRGAGTGLQGLCQARCHAGAVALARQVDQYVQMACVHVAAREDLGARLLVQRNDGAAHLRQPVEVRFQRFGARQRFEDFAEFLGAEALLAHAGQAQYLGHAAARKRQRRQRGGVARAGKQADKAMLAQDSALRIHVTHADEIELLVAVQSACHVGLDDGQRRVALGQGVEVAGNIRQAGAVDGVGRILQHADAARDVAFEFAHARLDTVIGVAEHFKAAAAGPFQEGGHFRAFFAMLGGSHGDGGQALAHGGGIAAHDGGVTRDHLQGGDQRSQGFRRQLLVEQYQHIRFERVARLAHRFDTAVSGAAHGQHGVHHAAHGQVLAAHGHDDGVDQVRHVFVQDQQGARHAATAIGITQGGDLAAAAGALGRLRKTVDQHGRQAVGRDIGQVFGVERVEPCLHQLYDRRCRLVRIAGRVNQLQRLCAQILWRVIHLASPLR